MSSRSTEAGWCFVSRGGGGITSVRRLRGREAGGQSEKGGSCSESGGRGHHVSPSAEAGERRQGEVKGGGRREGRGGDGQGALGIPQRRGGSVLSG